jgi:2,3-bisphosphoglycerate-independent phosphoglycerate mutase
MRGILVIIDGMGDLPNSQLNNMTPLEAANTPNMDFLATRGEIGLLYPVKPGFTPESDESIISIFGNDLVFGTRGQLEAIGEDVNLAGGDLVLRANFATIDSLKEGNILDRRTGRTLNSKEIEMLSIAINKIRLPCTFVFKPTILHQAVLILNGGFSENILGNDSTYIQGKTHNITKTRSVTPLDDEDNVIYTANVLNEFIKKANDVLEDHPLNKERKKRGLLPANYILVRSPGVEPPKIKKYKGWLSVSYFPLEKGFSKLSGMDLFTFEYPKLKGFDSYSNLWDGLRQACNHAMDSVKRHHKRYDYAYIHINEPDIAGHDNKPIEKKMMLEYIDKTLFSFLREFAPPNKIHVVVTANHSTPCRYFREDEWKGAFEKSWFC